MAQESSTLKPEKARGEGRATGSKVPTAGPSRGAEALPESVSYRLKRRLLGPPLVSDQLNSQRLGKPTALAVLSSDVMSSSAYATEEILRILVPIGGLAAFSLVTPVTVLIMAVLAVVTACYRAVVQAYPKAGGSYVVSRENFGPNAAQVAGAALLISYTITVAVSVAAGADAIISAVPALDGAAVPLAVVFVLVIAYGNLRGLREAGRFFAIPTYFFILNMAILIVTGLIRSARGDLGHTPHRLGQMSLGHQGGGLLLGVSVFYALKAFANGGSAMTGTEAISNGVSVFRAPQARNARTTLVIMSTILGTMFLGVSILAALAHVVPFQSGTPTVVSELGKLVYGKSVLGSALYGSLQAATALILILAANTSFTGFPFLVSFVAEDSFLPRQLTVRGHRLVFSNGIIVLTVASLALLVATQAKVAALIPMYAIGVFTGFTMAGAGMTRHFLRERGANWVRNVAVCAVAAVVCLTVVLVFAFTEFTSGAWVVVVVMPILIYGLMRTNAQYRAEDNLLAEGAAMEACEAPVLRHHTVFVLVDRIDLATARAIQYARALTPDNLSAVHFNLDERRAEVLVERWSQLGLSRMPLEVIECADRRLGRAILELAAEAVSDGQTELSILIPQRNYRRVWSVVLHGRNAQRIIEVVSRIPHVNATLVPFAVGGSSSARDTATGVDRLRPATADSPGADASASPGQFPDVPGTTPIAALEWRHPARVAGRVRALRVQPWAGVPTLECSLIDASGGQLTLVFLGRRHLAGVRTGTKLTVEGMIGEQRGRLAMINPFYELLSVPEEDTAAKI